MRRPLLLIGLVALGCPLLVDDRLTVVPAGSRSDAVAEAGASAAPSEDGSVCGESAIPLAAACPVVCDRCEAGRCIFDCQGQDACKGQTFNCPDGYACLVECAGKAACADGTVICPSQYDCNVECTDQDACKDSLVQCVDGNCNVRCTLDKSCEGLEILCGSGQCGAECLISGMRPRLNCGSACSCDPC